jgi:lysozyme family protein
MSFERVYYGKTISFEGGYVNDPADSGGETFRGISRRSHPNWIGWQKIDAAKRKVGATAKAIDKYFKEDTEMLEAVSQVYFKSYWMPLLGSPELPDKIMEKLFDTSNSLGFKLAVDGVMGTNTRNAALAIDEQATLKAYAKYQAAYYESLITKNPKNAKFRKGWLSRAAWIPS